MLQIEFDALFKCGAAENHMTSLGRSAYLFRLALKSESEMCQTTYVVQDASTLNSLDPMTID